MPANPIILLKLCREIGGASHEGLRALDRDTLLATQKALRTLKRDLDHVLLKLSFLDAQSLN